MAYVRQKTKEPPWPDDVYFQIKRNVLNNLSTPEMDLAYKAETRWRKERGDPV